VYDHLTRAWAPPWTRRTEAELRACGVIARAAPTAPGALAELTPQQRQIVMRLAAFA
jgi:hypothetical protein